MESDCRIPMACFRPRALALHALFWGLVSLRVFGASLLSDEKTAGKHLVTSPTRHTTRASDAPCWQLEDFVVTVECSQCSTKPWAACEQTGYVETVNCSKSNREEYKSCRSALMEEVLFWRMEGVVLGLMVLLALVVVGRQRSLDRLASEKVRRQIESI
ncbi:protein JTB isoform X1 [Gadus macrocephalus]|uniref:protein JTB isoform X1 n=1 Tax=Gadus macrocephalus TaxID=80720 RepID=UPI0028CBBD4F|nr:protein JTB isoform X1 [Gadus macrocephalus]